MSDADSDSLESDTDYESEQRDKIPLLKPAILFQRPWTENLMRKLESAAKTFGRGWTANYAHYVLLKVAKSIEGIGQLGKEFMCNVTLLNELSLKLEQGILDDMTHGHTNDWDVRPRIFRRNKEDIYGLWIWIFVSLVDDMARDFEHFHGPSSSQLTLSTLVDIKDSKQAPEHTDASDQEPAVARASDLISQHGVMGRPLLSRAKEIQERKEAEDPDDIAKKLQSAEQQVKEEAEDPDDFVKKRGSIRNEMAAEQARITELHYRKRKTVENMEEELQRLKAKRQHLEKQLASC